MRKLKLPLLPLATRSLDVADVLQVGRQHRPQILAETRTYGVVDCRILVHVADFEGFLERSSSLRAAIVLNETSLST